MGCFYPLFPFARILKNSKHSLHGLFMLIVFILFWVSSLISLHTAFVLSVRPGFCPSQLCIRACALTDPGTSPWVAPTIFSTFFRLGLNSLNIPGLSQLLLTFLMAIIPMLLKWSGGFYAFRLYQHKVDSHV